MDNSWDNLEPAPIEFMHGILLECFHEYRQLHGNRNRNWVEMSVADFNNIIAKAKMATYEKYHKLDLENAIPKSKL